MAAIVGGAVGMWCASAGRGRAGACSMLRSGLARRKGRRRCRGSERRSGHSRGGALGVRAHARREVSPPRYMLVIGKPKSSPQRASPVTASYSMEAFGLSAMWYARSRIVASRVFQRRSSTTHG